MNLENKMFTIFNHYPELVLAISTRDNGPMKIQGNLLNKFLVKKNQKNFFNTLNIKNEKVVRAGLIHGSEVVIVKDDTKGIPQADGLITNHKDIFLSITVADCLPIFIYDPDNKVICLIHAGWKGLQKNILSIAIQKLVNSFDSNPSNIIVGIGPGISKCHFEVLEDVANIFKNSFPKTIERRAGKIFLDLKFIAKEQLKHLGLQNKNIEVSQACTYCQENKYYSYRRDKYIPVKTMMVVFGIV